MMPSVDRANPDVAPNDGYLRVLTLSEENKDGSQMMAARLMSAVAGLAGGHFGRRSMFTMRVVLSDENDFEAEIAHRALQARLKVGFGYNMQFDERIRTFNVSFHTRSVLYADAEHTARMVKCVLAVVCGALMGALMYALYSVVFHSGDFHFSLRPEVDGFLGVIVLGCSFGAWLGAKIGDVYTDWKLRQLRTDRAFDEATRACEQFESELDRLLDAVGAQEAGLVRPYEPPVAVREVPVPQFLTPRDVDRWRNVPAFKQIRAAVKTLVTLPDSACRVLVKIRETGGAVEFKRTPILSPLTPFGARLVVPCVGMDGDMRLRLHTILKAGADRVGAGAAADEDAAEAAGLDGGDAVPVTPPIYRADPRTVGVYDIDAGSDADTAAALALIVLVNVWNCPETFTPIVLASNRSRI
ncbi:hypothetical protein GX586_11325 [bacterium]|nr:hypothetical protein [bacterium]